jgi:hypothetical protein
VWGHEPRDEIEWQGKAGEAQSGNHRPDPYDGYIDIGAARDTGAHAHHLPVGLIQSETGAHDLRPRNRCLWSVDRQSDELTNRPDGSGNEHGGGEESANGRDSELLKIAEIEGHCLISLNAAGPSGGDARYIAEGVPNGRNGGKPSFRPRLKAP